MHFIEYGSKYKLSNKFFNKSVIKLIVLSKFVIYSSSTCWPNISVVFLLLNISELYITGFFFASVELK